MAAVRGGEKLAAKLRELTEKLAQPATVRIGFLENSRYPDGTPVAMIAAIQDFGAPRAGVPPRPFFRNMIAARKGEWPAAIAGQLKATGYDVELTLKRTGEAVAGQLRESIQQTNVPPLKPATIKRKGFSKPLVDTGEMLKSVSYEVKAS
jgi:hypothetical protein